MPTNGDLRVQYVIYSDRGSDVQLTPGQAQSLLLALASALGKRIVERPPKKV